MNLFRKMTGGIEIVLTIAVFTSTALIVKIQPTPLATLAIIGFVILIMAALCAAAYQYNSRISKH